MITPVAIKPFVCGYTDQGTVYTDYDLNKTHLYVFEVQCDENCKWTFEFEDLLYFDNEVERYIGLFKAIVSIAKTIYVKALLNKVEIPESERFVYCPINNSEWYDFKLPTNELIEDLIKAFKATNFENFNPPLWNNKFGKVTCEEDKNEEELFTDAGNKVFHSYINSSNIIANMVSELPSAFFTSCNYNLSNIVYTHLDYSQGDEVGINHYDTFGELFEDIMWHLVLLVCYSKLV